LGRGRQYLHKYHTADGNAAGCWVVVLVAG
jgi:hypothetical protein